MNICWNHEASRFTDSAGYLKLVSDEMGLDTFVSETGQEADIVFNCESAHHFGIGRKLTFIYHIDPTWNHKGNISERIDECDAIFSTHMDVPYKDDPKFVFLPHAAHSTWYEPVPKEFDVFLPPSPPGPYKKRRELSELIASKFNTHTVGYGTPTRDYIREMSKCKIIFNQSGHNDVNRKIFDGMLHGILLTNDMEGLKEVGEADKHYFTYEGSPTEKIKWLLGGDLMNNYLYSTHLVLKEHTYHHRLLTILSCISKLL